VPRTTACFIYFVKLWFLQVFESLVLQFATGQMYAVFVAFHDMEAGLSYRNRGNLMICRKYESTKGTIGPGRRTLAYLLYYVITVSPACAYYIHHYASSVRCSVTHRAAKSLVAAGRCGVSEGSVSSFKSIT